MLEIKGQVLHRVRLHVRVPGWLSDLNVLLTRKLPKFLSRLRIVAENFEVFENYSFEWKVLWMNGILLVSSFCDVCSAVSGSISWARWLPVVTAELG